MTDWETFADIGTAAGTLILVGATFVAVRAAARSTRIVERALLAGQRPVLARSGPDGGTSSVQFADGRVFPLVDGRPLLREEAGVIYLAIPLCNVGASLAVLRGYRLQAEPASAVTEDPRGVARHLRGDPLPQSQAFSPQQRDLLISASRAGFWQAALRDPEAPSYRALAEVIRTGGRVTVDVLYGDHEGGQPSVTTFVLLPEERSWRCDATRYWSLPPGRELYRFDFT